MTTATPTPAPIQGHPDGCDCGRCGIHRMAGFEDLPHKTCNEHGRCWDCEGCVPCGMEADRQAEIGRLVRVYPAEVDRAIAAVGNIRYTVDRLLEAYDIETAEGFDGPDALAELDEIGRRLRNIRRIAAARYAIDREQEIAAALEDDDVPEFGDDIVVAFRRDQVNEWAGRRLTDAELAKINEVAAESAVPLGIFAIAAAIGQGQPEEEPPVPEHDLGPEIDDMGGMSDVTPPSYDPPEV